MRCTLLSVALKLPLSAHSVKIAYVFLSWNMYKIIHILKLNVLDFDPIASTIEVYLTTGSLSQAYST